MSSSLPSVLGVLTRSSGLRPGLGPHVCFYLCDSRSVINSVQKQPPPLPLWGNCRDLSLWGGEGHSCNTGGAAAPPRCPWLETPPPPYSCREWSQRHLWGGRNQHGGRPSPEGGRGGGLCRLTQDTAPSLICASSFPFFFCFRPQKCKCQSPPSLRPNGHFSVSPQV